MCEKPPSACNICWEEKETTEPWTIIKDKPCCSARLCQVCKSEWLKQQNSCPQCRRPDEASKEANEKAIDARFALISRLFQLGVTAILLLNLLGAVMGGAKLFNAQQVKFHRIVSGHDRMCRKVPVENCPHALSLETKERVKSMDVECAISLLLPAYPRDERGNLLDGSILGWHIGTEIESCPECGMTFLNFPRLKTHRYSPDFVRIPARPDWTIMNAADHDRVIKTSYTSFTCPPERDCYLVVDRAMAVANGCL